MERSCPFVVANYSKNLPVASVKDFHYEIPCNTIFLMIDKLVNLKATIFVLSCSPSLSPVPRISFTDPAFVIIITKIVKA